MEKKEHDSFAVLQNYRDLNSASSTSVYFYGAKGPRLPDNKNDYPMGMFDCLINSIVKLHGITKELKAKDPADWRRQINSLRHIAE